MSEDTRASQLLERITSEFTLGVATASWQIEGDSKGRGRSIWDDFAAVQENLKRARDTALLGDSDEDEGTMGCVDDTEYFSLC